MVRRHFFAIIFTIWLIAGDLNLVAVSNTPSDGSVGCLFSEKVCAPDEWCFDDQVFGKCEPISGPDVDLHRFRLEKQDLNQLSRELRRLYNTGYRWNHSYTQCVVKKMLESYRYGVLYSPTLCHHTEDEDLQRALRSLEAEEELDPSEVAVIKYNPSRINEYSKFGDENFQPNIPYLEDDVISDIIEYDKTRKDQLDNDLSSTTELPAFKTKRVDPVVTDDLQVLDEVLSDVPTEDLVELMRQADELDTQQKVDSILASYEGREIIDDAIDRVLIPMGDETVPVVDFDIQPEDLTVDYRDGGRNDWGVFLDDDARSDSELPIYPTIGQNLGDDFARHPRYDVKKPGPFYKVNNYHANWDGDDEWDSRGSQRELNSDEIRHQIEKDEIARLLAQEVLDELTANRDEDSNNGTNEQRKTETATEGEGEVEPTEQPETNLNKTEHETEPNTKPDDRKRTNLEYWSGEGDNDLQYYPNASELDETDTRILDLLGGTRYELGENREASGIFDGLSDDDLQEIVADIAENDPELLDRLSKLAQFNRDTYDKQVASYFDKSAENDEWIPPISSDMLSRQFPFRIAQSDPKFQKKLYGLSPTLSPISNIRVREPEAQISGTDQPTPALERSTIEPTSQYDVIDSTYAFVQTRNNFYSWKDGSAFVTALEKRLKLYPGTFSNIRVESNQVTFKVNRNPRSLNASAVATRAEELSEDLRKLTGKDIINTGIGDQTKISMVGLVTDESRLFLWTFVACGGVVGVLAAAGVFYVVRKHAQRREKLQRITHPDTEASLDYQDLCRQRMSSGGENGKGKPDPLHVGQQRVSSLSRDSETSQKSPSSRSSTSSWNEEPVTSNMDISTGHMVLSYMEDHLKNKDRLEQEWLALCAYEAEPCSVTIATQDNNMARNRYEDMLPYDHSRVVLNDATNIMGSDYINASTITDHDPRNPAYIATQGPLPHTAADFWQMVWEQGSVVLVSLTRPVENGIAMCHRYWPEEGSELYHIYEIHLVSEHIWCEEYVVRSFYLKNVKTGETRTVTQFHFLSWPDNGVPASTRALLDFRRKVNKSYRGRSCPIVVHCSDGVGRAGTYCLIDMVLNRMAKGAKEIDISATLEHIRDQRGGMVKTKAQFEFALMAVAEEVHAILKAITQ